jgi:hypothetical protein
MPGARERFVKAQGSNIGAIRPLVRRGERRGHHLPARLGRQRPRRVVRPGAPADRRILHHFHVKMISEVFTARAALN